MKRRIWMATAIVLGVAVAGSYGGSMKPAIKSGNQTLIRLSTEVTVPSAYSEGPGWVVIHESGMNGAGPVVGHAALKSGSNRNTLVTLDRPAKDGEKFYAMLHVDKGKVGAFEDPGADVPVLDSKAQIIMEPFTVKVPAGTPAVRLTVTEAGPNSACTVSGIEPKAYAGAIGPETVHPTLMLRPGWRYEIDEKGNADRQFQLLERGMNGTSDVVLLSETGMGALQSDPSVDFYAKDGALRFTLSDDLTKQLSGYRCGIAPSETPGAIKIM
jgi:hypothetical protein